MCYHTIEAGCQKALVLQRWKVDRIDGACIGVDTSKIGAMFDASDNPRVEFTCHDVVTTRVVSTCADVGTSNVYSRCHVNMMSKNAGEERERGDLYMQVRKYGQNVYFMMGKGKGN